MIQSYLTDETGAHAYISQKVEQFPVLITNAWLTFFLLVLIGV